MAQAEYPRFLALDQIPFFPVEVASAFEPGRQAAAAVQLGESGRVDPHLGAVGDFFLSEAGDLGLEERGVDFRQDERGDDGIGRAKPGPKRPDRRVAFDARIARQPLQRGQAQRGFWRMTCEPTEPV